MRVLVGEADRELALAIRSALVMVGIEADMVSTAEEADLAMKAIAYEAVILDIDLPDMDGLVFLRKMRWRKDPTSVLVLSDKRGLRERVGGLKAGADDYLEKPFNVAELVARVQALLRRPRSGGANLLFGNLSLDVDTRVPSIDGKRMPCTPKEEALLEALMMHAGNPVPTSLLASALRSRRSTGESSANVVEVYVHRLRKRLADGDANVFIKSIRGFGYGLSLLKRA
jgi:DNA-binding response OmpR family regulator